MTSAAAQLAAGRARIEQLPLDGDRWELIAPGLHRTYRRGRKRLRVALLREEVQHRRTAFADPGDQRHLLEEIDQRRGELQFAAISVGQRIYADKPKRFTKRVERRWEAWREREPVGA